MKSALCLLSGKSCAWLIEMFIRQIYRDEEQAGGLAAPGDPAEHCSKVGVLGGSLGSVQRKNLGEARTGG